MEVHVQFVQPHYFILGVFNSLGVQEVAPRFSIFKNHATAWLQIANTVNNIRGRFVTPVLFFFLFFFTS